MLIETPKKTGRGRPPKPPEHHQAVRSTLIRSGMELLTERGYSATGIDAILKSVGVPKGSFYYYFDSKDEFVRQVIDGYADYFAKLLDKHLADEARPPLQRILDFVATASDGMARFDFRRGCLLGNLGQEMSTLPNQFRSQIETVFTDWERRVSNCLEAAKERHEISASADTKKLAYLFWIGWEGAVLRAKLERSDRPLKIFASEFISTYQRSTQA